MKNITLFLQITRKDGISVIVLVMVISLVGALAYVLTSLTITKQKSVPLSFRPAHAFYLAQAGIEYAIRYTSDNESSFWIDPNNIFPITRGLGAGSFTVTYETGTRSITSTGKVSSGERQIKLSRFPEYLAGGDIVPVPGKPPYNKGKRKIIIPISNNSGSKLYIFQIDIAKDKGGKLKWIEFGGKRVHDEKTDISTDHGNPTQIDFSEKPYYALKDGKTKNNRYKFQDKVAKDTYTVIYHYYFKGGSELDDYTCKLEFTIS